MTPLRTVFMGTAPLAATALRALSAASDIRLVAVVTQPDKPSGRDLRIRHSPVKQAALEAGQPVLQPGRARDAAFLQDLQSLAPDLIIVAAYGQILPSAILDLPPLGCLNIHASLLPQYRGAAPIQWAILDGQVETGVTIMKMDAGLDTGPMLATAKTPIGPDETGGSLHDRLAELGARLLLETIPAYASGRLQPAPQPAAGASYARKIIKEDGWIDWSTPAAGIENKIRGLNPWPTAFTGLTMGGALQRLTLWRAQVDPDRAGQPGTVLESSSRDLVVACGEQSLRLLELQREGRRRVTAAEFLAGCPLAPGTQLAQRPASPG